MFRLMRVNQYLTKTVKHRSRRILRLWSDHCEYIIAQRLRRGQQMLCLYRRIWDEQALSGILQLFRKQLERHAKGIMFSGVGLASAFDWDSGRISYDSVRKNFDEIELVKRLRVETIYCDTCGQRLVIDCKIDGIVYCTCAKGNTCASRAVAVKPSQIQPYEKPWQPYMERRNMIVWRREHQPGLFAYKVYAIYDDVSAEEFLHVQTDTEYRKTWDKTAISLDVIDIDPVHRNKSHIIYWEMQWPKLFANRDYVFNRRHFIDRNRKLIIIVNKSVSHPSSPIRPNVQRVNDYWSCMVIRSTSNSFKTPGLEYVLTYFDNPGIVLPQSVQSWVAQKQLPEFLHKLYIATLDYAQVHRQAMQQQNQQRTKCNKLGDIHFRDPGYEPGYPPEPEICLRAYQNPTADDDDDDDDDNGDDTDFDDGKNKRDINNSNSIKTSTSNNDINRFDESRKHMNDKSSPGENKFQTDSQTNDEEDNNVNNKSNSWWRYLLPYYYFV